MKAAELKHKGCKGSEAGLGCVLGAVGGPVAGMVLVREDVVEADVVKVGEAQVNL